MTINYAMDVLARTGLLLQEQYLAFVHRQLDWFRKINADLLELPTAQIVPCALAVNKKYFGFLERFKVTLRG